MARFAARVVGIMLYTRRSIGIAARESNAYDVGMREGATAKVKTVGLLAIGR